VSFYLARCIVVAEYFVFIRRDAIVVAKYFVVIPQGLGNFLCRKNVRTPIIKELWIPLPNRSKRLNL
jgi:hypothetical protein